jgi:WD40 repeat protein
VSADRNSDRRVDRRSLLAAGAGVGAIAMIPSRANADAHPAARSVAGSGGGAAAVPPSVRSRQALLKAAGAQAVAPLPITQNGTTYNYAQVVRWLDDEHFAVGRWDGTMSVFDFETAPFVGPMLTEAVNNPAAQGVRMITKLPRNTLVTSNDDRSILVWKAQDAGWDAVRLSATLPYDAALGAVTSGAWFPVGHPQTLVLGHDSGYLSLWSFNPVDRSLRLAKTINVQNPTPVNPWGLHTVYGLCPYVSTGPDATAVAGSDDGYVSIVRVPSGVIASQTVFNPSAQRGINSVSTLGDKLLVANCSVGADDANLWYFSINPSTWALTLLDRMNLIIDPAEIQSFNFSTTWGRYSGGPCWFAGTEEGALWMGTADTSLHLIGYQGLGDGAIGAALDYNDGPGRLSAVIQNLFQFTTGG